MIVAVGPLEHEVAAGALGRAAAFDREGYAVGRQMFAPETLRALRAPLIQAMISDGQVEAMEEDADRFRWIGDEALLDRERHRLALQARAEDLLLRSGLAAQAIEAVWGRRPAIWQRVALFVMVPGAPTRAHRDGWQMMGRDGPGQHGNLWCPLTRIEGDDGPLAIAVGSHRIADPPPHVPMPYPVHQDVPRNTGSQPAPEVLAPLWRSTSFDLGDALLFRPDIVHSTMPNNSSCVRIAIVIGVQNARAPLPVGAGLSLDCARDLTDVEWITLALLTLQPTSPWLARCAFYARGVVGRLWTEQPADLVERAFATLRARGLVEPHGDQDRSWIHRVARRRCSELPASAAAQQSVPAAQIPARNTMREARPSPSEITAV